jgi:uncharacterized protein YuzE
MKRFLNKIGEFDYDFKNDILFFKVKEREYSYSIELYNLVIDFDEENFIVGLQIIGASKILNLSKEKLKQVKNFKFNAEVDNGMIKINLLFSTFIRNKIREHNPIIFERIDEQIPNSEIVCTT